MEKPSKIDKNKKRDDGNHQAQEWNRCPLNRSCSHGKAVRQSGPVLSCSKLDHGWGLLRLIEMQSEASRYSLDQSVEAWHWDWGPEPGESSGEKAAGLGTLLLALSLREVRLHRGWLSSILPNNLLILSEGEENQCLRGENAFPKTNKLALCQSEDESVHGDTLE